MTGTAGVAGCDGAAPIELAAPYQRRVADQKDGIGPARAPAPDGELHHVEGEIRDHAYRDTGYQQPERQPVPVGGTAKQTVVTPSSTSMLANG